jgi:hypothetical protein
MRIVCCLIALAALPAIAQVEGPPVADAQTASVGYVAMTPGQRWNDFMSTSVASPSVGLRIFTSAALSHFHHEPLSWGMGPRGYFERAGSHYARFLATGGIHSGLAAALGQDTRYYHEPEKCGWRRAARALRRTVITRNREGRSVFDLSEVASLYAGPAIASAWHPRREAVYLQALHGGNFGLAAQAAGNLVREFGPDVKRLLFKK